MRDAAGPDLSAPCPLPVGDPARCAARTAVLASFVLAAVFWVVVEGTKELPALYVREPWQDDPYDALVSFMMSTVPFWTVLCALRLPLVRPSRPLPARRALDLVRALRFQDVLIAITLVSEWISVARGDHRSSWNATTGVEIGLLVLLTAFTALTLWWSRAALTVFGRLPGVPTQPDWPSDVIAAGEWAAGQMGWLERPARILVRWLDRFIAVPLRRHPVAVTGALSCLGGILVSLPQVVIEGYPPLLAVLVMLVSAASLFAFLVIAGAHLQVVGRRTRYASPAVHAVVSGALAMPLAAASRDTIWAWFGTGEDWQSIGHLTAMVCLIGVAVVLVVFAAEAAVRRLRPRVVRRR